MGELTAWRHLITTPRIARQRLRRLPFPRRSCSGHPRTSYEIACRRCASYNRPSVLMVGSHTKSVARGGMAKAKYERSADDVVETLRNARKRENRGTPLRCSLLIGAGCSFTAGIPLARGFVETIRDRYPRTFAQVREETYPHVMAALCKGERRALIREYINKCRVNHAHLAIAQLIKNGYVDRVLTTNFDPLVARACALCNIHIAVYDFAATQAFDPADAPDRAVFPPSWTTHWLSALAHRKRMQESRTGNHPLIRRFGTWADLDRCRLQWRE